MLARFLPQTVPFFKLLMEQNAVLQRMAQSLIVVMENTYESEDHLKQINILEEEADKLNRKITWHLSQTFITPIDREDIHAINLAQERVAAPWTFSIGPWLQKGDNRLEIEVYNTLGNQFEFTPTPYKTGIRSGLLGKVKLWMAEERP